MPHVSIIALALLILLSTSSPQLIAQTLPSVNGDHYQLTIQSRLDPIRTHRIHAWELELRDDSGQRISGAEFTIDGGMPAHNHGFPTAPRVTEELAPGLYLLEGMRFHMPGEWEVRFRIKASNGVETLRVAFSL